MASGFSSLAGGSTARNNNAPPPRSSLPLPLRSTSSKTVHTLGGASALEHADDELTPSVLSLNLTNMAGSQVLLPEPRYPGEDTRPTSSRELYGFYSYGWAAEVFVVCGVGSFIPITLEQLAREVGRLLADPSKSCNTGFNFRPPPSFNETSIATRAAEDGQCVVNIGFGKDIYINTASFAMYTFSVSVLVQALVIISMSGAADHGRYRKKLLLGFAVVGAVATMLFVFVTPKVLMIGALLAIISNTCFGASFVLLNSFLPLLVRQHPSMIPVLYENDSVRDSFSIEEDNEPRDSLGDIDRNMVDSTTGLLSNRHAEPDKTRPDSPSAASAGSPALQLSTRISSNGMAIGYVAAIIVQIVSAMIVFFAHGSLFSLELVLLFVGAWWLIFSVPAAMFLRPRPGPPLESSFDSSSPGESSKAQTWAAYLTHAWVALGRTIMRARRLKDMLLFLAAWFLLSDGIATVSGTAILFARTTLHMQPAGLAMINVVVMLFGVLGAVGWSHVSRIFGLKASQTILVCICVFELIPIYALLGYIPGLQRLGFLGLQAPWEMYPLGAVYGLVMGGLSSYCRSLFGELIPPGNEASFYALYAITDKGSSVFGPAIVGAITDATGSIRPAFWFLAVLIGLPGPLLYFVDVERGKREARRLAMEFDGGKAVGEADGDGAVVYARVSGSDEDTSLRRTSGTQSH